MTQQDDLLADGMPAWGAVASEKAGRPASSVEAVLIAAYLLGLSILLVSALIQLWPAPTPAGGTAPTTAQVSVFTWTVNISDEVRLLLLVVFTGALGGILHALRSVAWYIGQQELKRNWLLTYVTQPFVGSTLAVLFYLVVRGGFFSPQASFQQTSPFGFAAMAGLIGMFSPQAVLKLKEVAETILTKPPAGKDPAPQEPTQRQLDMRPAGPTPTASSTTPNGMAQPPAGQSGVVNQQPTAQPLTVPTDKEPTRTE